MAKLIRRDFEPDDPIFREGSQTFVPPPRPRPARQKPLTSPPMSDEEMADQYSLQARMERALRGLK